MSWYYCSGCGASQKCEVCGATECSQDLYRNASQGTCPGCVRALGILDDAKAGKIGIPWNIRNTPRGVRPWRHLRKRETRYTIHRKHCRGMFCNTNRWKRVQGRWVRNDYDLTY